MIDVILAAPDLAAEAELVREAPNAGVRIVRRCVDAVDLLAVAAGDPGSPVVVSPGLPRLPVDAVERLGRSRSVIGLAVSVRDAGALERLGIPALMLPASASDAWAQVRGLLETRPGSGVWSTGVWSDDMDEPSASSVPQPIAGGRIIAVWGPPGAPGRTTVAVGVSEDIARRGTRCVLIDADTYAPSVTLALGIVEDASGLVVACRHSDNATLTPGVLAGLCHPLSSTWHVLGGVGRPDRWPEVRATALDRLWDVARETFDVTVIDVSSCLEADDGPWSSRRNAATLSALSAADRVLVVADDSSLGAARLATAWPGLLDASPLADRVIVRNRAGRQERGWAAALTDHGLSAPILAVPRDERAAAGCWAAGRGPGERARRSSLRRALGAVAERAVSP